MTPYPEINLVLQGFSSRIQAILGSQFIGLFLYGSLALGDFDPVTSDIDFIVVTRTNLPTDLFNALQEMHTEFDRSGSPWAKKVEAAYIPVNALNHAAPTEAQFPQIEKGTRLFRAPLEIGWAFQRYSLREYGMVITGPDPRSLIEPVDPADFRRAAGMILREWVEKSSSDPSWIDWAKRRSSQAFIILTLCRLLFSLETESVASKHAAAIWAQDNLDVRWDMLIQRSLAGQQDKRETSDTDLNNMLALLNYVAKWSQTRF